MYLLVDKQQLDVLEGAISIKKMNNAFCYGTYMLSRTQSFNIPKTPNNMRILGLGQASDYGSKERIRYDAQLIEGIVSYNGILYIDEVSNSFRCVFVFGEFLPLKKLSEIKEISTFLPEQEIYISYQKKADETLDFVQNVLYLNKNSIYMMNSNSSYDYVYSNILPSLSVREIFEKFNARYDFIQFDADKIDADYRLILGRFSGSEKNDIIFAKTSNNVMAYNNDLKYIFSIRTEKNVVCSTGNRGTYEEHPMQVLYAKNVELTFPIDFPDDLFCLADYTHYNREDGFVVVDLEFFGDYSFDWQERTTSLANEGERLTTGVPLAGRTISINSVLRTYTYGNNVISVVPRISFYKKENFHNLTQGLGFDTGRYKGFFDGDASPFSFVFPNAKKEIERDNLGAPYKALLLSNLPTISPFELYRAMAILENKIIVVKNGIITNEEFSGTIISPAIMSINSIKRQGLTSAQYNIIEFDSSNMVESERIKQIYRTDNVNLEDNNIIYKYPFSEGAEIKDNDLYVNDVEEVIDENEKWSNFEVIAKNATIALAGRGEVMKRVYLSYNQLLYSIYTASTRIIVDCSMSMLEFSMLKENTILLIDGHKYIWTDAQYNNNRVRMTLFSIT